MKKILTILLTTLIISSCSISKSIPDNPKNIQVRVTEIISNKNNKVECKGLSQNNDTVYLRYGWTGWRSKNRAIEVGTLIYAMGSYDDKQGVWYCRNLKVGK